MLWSLCCCCWTLRSWGGTTPVQGRDQAEEKTRREQDGGRDKGGRTVEARPQPLTSPWGTDRLVQDTCTGEAQAAAVFRHTEDVCVCPRVPPLVSPHPMAAQRLPRSEAAAAGEQLRGRSQDWVGVWPQALMSQSEKHVVRYKHYANDANANTLLLNNNYSNDANS